MFALLLTATSLCLPLFALQDDEAVSERDLREAYKKGLARSSPEERADAVNQYGFATRDLPDDEGASKLVARQLKIALKDDDPQVVAAGIVALSWGRDVETTLDAMEDVIDDLRNTAAKYATRPGEENRAIYQEAVRLFENSVEIVGRHRCDAAEDILMDQMRTLRPQAGQGPLASDLIAPLSEGLLALGSYDAVELVIKTTNVFSGDTLADDKEGNNFTLAARTLHDNLSAFADEIGKIGPPWSPQYDVAWRDWFKEARDELPKKLGKLETPVDAPPYENPDQRMMPEEPKPGDRERP